MNTVQPITMYARKTDPDTSHEAAELSKPQRTAERMLALVVASGWTGCCKDDFEDAMPDVAVVCFSPIPAKLVDQGLIHDSGQRRVGRAGRKQVVFIAGPGAPRPSVNKNIEVRQLCAAARNAVRSLRSMDSYDRESDARRLLAAVDAVDSLR